MRILITPSCLGMEEIRLLKSVKIVGEYSEQYLSIVSRKG